MQTKVLEVINDIRASKNMEAVVTLNEGDKLRDDLGLTSFDLAELTVRIEDEFNIDIFEMVSLILLVRFMQNLAKCNGSISCR